jgi:F-box interacting protein
MLFSSQTKDAIARAKKVNNHSVYFFGSCNGILCLAAEEHAYSNIIVRLWNPSIRKFNTLPPLGDQQTYGHIMKMYGFGYDPVSDKYKVVAVFHDLTHVKVHNLGTNSWKSIPMFPYFVVPIQKSGQCVSGTINWLASKDTMTSQCFILSLDLGNESYKEVLLPNYGEVDACTLHLSVLRDCLIMFCGDDVWVMKEYGNKESWTKLFTISYMPAFVKAIYTFEDEYVLLKRGKDWDDGYIFYNCRDGTSKLIGYLNMRSPEVCVESLISPCS